MNEKKKIDLGITALDEMFFDDRMRADAKLPKIHEIPLDQLDPFPDHPFQVRMDEDMDQLVESVRERGILTPVVVRPKEDGRYEIVSGHRRVKACELAGLPAVKAEIRELTKDEAVIVMVESNLQRSKILPSEKAFSYKMRLEAMKRMPGRPVRNNSDPVGPNFGTRSNQQLADEVGDSKTQVQRYIRLTYLIPELLDLVDEGRISMRPAVELSYLDQDEQGVLLEAIEYNDATPSHTQAIKLRRMSEDQTLTRQDIFSIMYQDKPNQMEKFYLPYQRTKALIPEDVPGDKMTDYIMEALEFYGQHRQPHKSRGGDAR